jgi:hypothetical protein
MKRDLRRYSRQTRIRLVIGFILILFLVGDGLIYLFYGRDAAGMGLICLLMGMAPVVLVWLVLTLLGWVGKKLDER